MTIHVRYYGYSTGIFRKEGPMQSSCKKTVRFLDLIRPDFYLNFNVDEMVGIMSWLKKEIKRLVAYSGSCDSMYYWSKRSRLAGKDYLDDVRKEMSQIFLGRASCLGRYDFDRQYDLFSKKILPIRYMTSHQPLEWGESQLDVLRQITEHDTQANDKPPRITTWHPNKCHPRARTIWCRQLVVEDDGFWYRINYSYPDDSSSWEIRIKPQPKELLVPFMLGVRQLFKRGLKRQYLKSIGDSRFSSTYTLDLEKLFVEV